MTPTGTYRLQLRREFGFHDAAAVVPYLASLGVSHVYCSPVLDAVPGSAHGYDVVDHTRLGRDLGGDEGWAALVGACRAYGLGLVVDVVPNHMALPVPESLNRAFWDVLRVGRESPYADWFDVDWEMHEGRVLLPVLGQDLDECVAAGELTLDGDVLRYFDHEFPVAPGSAGADLESVLAAQHYLPANWREASTGLNYRRFFDVTSLVGVRVERPAVFDATHERLLELVHSGEADGLRIDHPDGLADPGGYLDRLAEATGGRTWTVVEKILEHGETLPTDWKCAGTTGYDAVTALTHALLQPAGEGPLTDLYAELAGQTDDFDTVVEQSKRQVVEQLFGSEVRRLLRDIDAEGDEQIRLAIVELLVAFDVYRAYAGDPASKARIDDAAARATRRAPQLRDAIEQVTRLLHREDPAQAAFAVRFEQTTGPVMAKGVEDTAFYRYHRLVALNEVGGDPGGFGLDVAGWHDRCATLAREWPAAMTTLSTHDTKRSEDVRARLLVLAELPDEWRDAVSRWKTAAERHGPPDANTDYLFWQTLVGAHPITADRLGDYLLKAVREAKRETSWTDPDDDYEQRLRSYVDAVVADDALTADVTGWVEHRLRRPGDSNSLAQKLLQLTMPGVPDVYQGQELTGFALVDPDNRRPVDYDTRRSALTALDAGDAVEAKLLVTAATLRLRRERPEAFAGSYTPVTVTGSAADHAIAFRRGDDVLAVVTRWPVGLQRRGGWSDTRLELPDGEWHDALTDRPARPDLAGLLHELPVALLVRQGGARRDG